MLSLAAKQAVYVIFPHIPATVGWTNYFNVTVFPIAEKKKKITAYPVVFFRILVCFSYLLPMQHFTHRECCI